MSGKFRRRLMTIVIASRRADEILMLADTMIHNENERRSNPMPGRLKLVIIGHCVTVGFAGNADRASVAVRNARTALRNSGLPAVMDLLTDDSTNGDTDYLVGSHQPHAALFRIRNGARIEIPDICAIGDDAPFKDLLQNCRSSADDKSAHGDLRSSFIDRVSTTKSIGDVVGGFPVAMIGTPEHHRYPHHSFFYTFDMPPIRWGETVEQSIDDVYSGINHFQVSVMGNDQSDAPVIGVCLLQARTGYVYSPIEQLEAIKVPLLEDGIKWEGREEEMFAKLRKAVAEHTTSAAKL